MTGIRKRVESLIAQSVKSCVLYSGYKLQGQAIQRLSAANKMEL